MNGGEIGPGDSFSASPVIYNNSTEEMYVFIEMKMPYSFNELEEFFYDFDFCEDWILVESKEGAIIYAYANSEMFVLQPGESTTPLTTEMSMKQISYEEYAFIDDINFTITDYAIGIDEVSTNPIEAWNICKLIGNME